MTRKIRVIARFNLMWGTLCILMSNNLLVFNISKMSESFTKKNLILNVFFPWTLSECKKTNLKRSFWIDSFLFSFYWYFEVKIHKSKLLQKTNFKCRIICGDFYASGNLTRVRKRIKLLPLTTCIYNPMNPDPTPIYSVLCSSWYPGMCVRK